MQKVKSENKVGDIKRKVYSYLDVCNLSCDACRMKVPDTASIAAINGAYYEHHLNGRSFPCGAAAWRNNREVHKVYGGLKEG